MFFQILITGNILIVGDDAQSIYSFRGANYENKELISFEYNQFVCSINL